MAPRRSYSSTMAVRVPATTLVAEAAADYQKARADAEPLSRAAKGNAEGLLNEVLAALGDAGAFRIKADPPGAAGCIAFVVSTGTSAPTAFESAFAPSGTLGIRGQWCRRRRSSGTRARRRR
ncbi:MAG: hypothetical protein ACLTDR_04820 [Adlercreutzia equolifaciens]